MAKYRYAVLVVSQRNRAVGVLSNHHTFRAAGDAARKHARWAKRTGVSSGLSVIRDSLDSSIWNPGGIRMDRKDWPEEALECGR